MSTTVAELKAVLAVDTRPLETGLKRGEQRIEAFADKAEQVGEAAADGLTKPLAKADPGKLAATKRIEEFAEGAAAKGTAAAQQLVAPLKAVDPGPLRRLERRLDEFVGSVREKGRRLAENLVAGLKRIDTGNLDKLGNALSLSLTAPVAAGAVLAVKSASDLQESMSKVNVVFGTSAAGIQAWSQTAAQSFGQSRQQALEAAGTFGNLFVSMELGAAPAAEMSKRLVVLASDLASFNNVSPEDALLALRAGLVGEAEPLRRFGVNLNEASLKAEALRLGLVRSTKEALEPGIKAQAAYSLILQQTATAQGDFARTAEGLANRTRTAKAEIVDTAAAFGDQLLPMVNDGMKVGGEFLRVVNALPEPVKQAGLAAGLLGAALGPVAKGFVTAIDLGKALKGLLVTKTAATVADTAATVANTTAEVAETAASGNATRATAAETTARQAHTRALVAESLALEANTKAGLANSMAVKADPGSIAKGRAVGGLGRGVGLLGGLGVGAAIVAGGAVVAQEAGNWAESRAGKERVGWGDMLRELNPFRSDADRAREADEKAAAAAAEVRSGWGGTSPRAALQAQQAAAKKTAAPQDPEELLKAADAAFDAQKAKLAAQLAAGEAETEAQREAVAMVPLLTQRQQELAKRAAELKPDIETNAKAAQEYHQLEKEIADLEGDKLALQQKAQKEAASHAKQLANQARELREQGFRARELQLEALLATGPEDTKAQREAAAKAGLLQERQQELAREAQSLLGRTDADSRKRLGDIGVEQGQLQLENARLQADAVKERAANAKQVREAQDKLFAAEVAADEQELDARLATVEEGQRARAAAAMKLPFLEQVRQELIAGLNDLLPGTEAYVKQEAEIWKLEERQANLLMDANKEAKEGQQKAIDAAKKQASEQAEVLELKSQHTQAQIANNPFLNQRQRRGLMANAQLEQYRHLMTAVEGETEKERLQRQIQAEGLKGQIFKSIGGGFRRTLGGGLAPTGDPRLLAAVSRQMDAIAAQAGTGTVRATAAVRTATPVPVAAGVQPHPNEMQARPGESLEAFLARRDAGFRPESLMRTVVHDARQEASYRAQAVTQRGSDQWLAAQTPTRPAPTHALAQQAAAGNPVVFQVTVAPGSPAQLSQQLRTQYERLSREVHAQYYALGDDG